MPLSPIILIISSFESVLTSRFIPKFSTLSFSKSLVTITHFDTLPLNINLSSIALTLPDTDEYTGLETNELA